MKPGQSYSDLMKAKKPTAGALKIRGVSIKDMSLSSLQLAALKAFPSSPIQKEIHKEIQERHKRGEKAWHPDDKKGLKKTEDDLEKIAPVGHGAGGPMAVGLNALNPGMSYKELQRQDGGFKLLGDNTEQGRRLKVKAAKLQAEKELKAKRPDIKWEEYTAKSERLEKAPPLVFEGDEKTPFREVIRWQNKEGKGPYTDPNRHPEIADLADTHASDDHFLRTPTPSIDTKGDWKDPNMGFTQQDHKEMASGKDKPFAFENHKQMNKWFQPHEQELLRRHGYEPVKIKAKRIWSSGRQAFFEPYEDTAKSENLEKGPISSEQPSMQRPHFPSTYECLDRIETFKVPGKAPEHPYNSFQGADLYHHVFVYPPLSNSGYVKTLHALSYSADPWEDHKLIASSAVGEKPIANEDDWDRNHSHGKPWTEGKFAQIGETITSGAWRGYGLGKKLYEGILKWHGRLASDSSTSKGADGIWKHLLSQPDVKGAMGPIDQKGVHWAEHTGEKPTPIAVKEYGNKSEQQMSMEANARSMTKSEPARKEVSSVAVMDAEGKILMGKRRDSGRWTLPGGHLDEGEHHRDGAVRELMEEAGIEAKHSDMQHLVSEDVTTHTGKPYRIHAYKVVVPEGTSTSMQEDPDKEVHRWQWVDAKEGLPHDIRENLHSPKNTVLAALGLLPQNPFEKAAGKLKELLLSKGEKAIENIDQQLDNYRKPYSSTVKNKSGERRILNYGAGNNSHLDKEHHADAVPVIEARINALKGLRDRSWNHMTPTQQKKLNEIMDEHAAQMQDHIQLSQ